MFVLQITDLQKIYDSTSPKTEKKIRPDAPGKKPI